MDKVEYFGAVGCRCLIMDSLLHSVKLMDFAHF